MVVGEREQAVLEQRLSLFVCPECPERFEKPEDLGPHLERHREITKAAPPSPRGKPRSFPCPKDCGRHFPKLTGEDFRAHYKLCDGSVPIALVIEKKR